MLHCIHKLHRFLSVEIIIKTLLYLFINLLIVVQEVFNAHNYITSGKEHLSILFYFHSVYPLDL